MRLLDLHCDTPLALWRGDVGLRDNKLCVDLNRIPFNTYVQLAAHFCPMEVSDANGMAQTQSVFSHLLRCLKNEARATLITTKAALTTVVREERFGFIPTLEDARVLNGDLAAIDTLFSLGFRLVTPLWRDESCIGGAWNTDAGLTEFGRAALRAMLARGFILDLSHASRRSHAEIIALCRQMGRSPVATHSNAFSLAPHARNLTDAQIREIAALGGLIGINFYPPFLTADPPATLAHIIAHMRHIVRHGGEDAVAIGTDFDGVDALPCDISGIWDMPLLTDILKKSGFSPLQIEKLYFKNAFQFLKNNLPT